MKFICMNVFIKLYNYRYVYIVYDWDYDIMERDDIKLCNYSICILYIVCSLYINIILEKLCN